MNSDALRIQALLGLVADAYKRMATNREEDYRRIQQDKLDQWLEELTQLWEKNPLLFADHEK